MQKDSIISISVMAQLLNIHQRTLRIYDTEKLLSPMRTNKNRRLYSLNDLEKGKLILYLTRNLALNLNGVKLILKIIENYKISFDEIKQIVLDTRINEEENIIKTNRRGRKAKI